MSGIVGFVVCIFIIATLLIAWIILLNIFIVRFRNNAPYKLLFLLMILMIALVLSVIWAATTIRVNRVRTTYLISESEYELEEKEETINLFAFYYQTNSDVTKLVGIAHPEPQKCRFLQFWTYEKWTREICSFDFSDEREKYIGSEVILICPMSWIEEIQTRRFDLDTIPLPESEIIDIISRIS